jgi:hypothetical protein
VFTYAAGTTTPQATYTDNTGTTQNTNPVILDAGGRASIWLTGSAYKFAVWSSGGANCATGIQQYTVDGITAPNFGVVSVLNSASANAASAGFIRMANGDVIDWRNAANTANIGLSQAGVASAGTGNVADALDYGDLSHGALQAQAFMDFSGAPAQSGDLRGGNNVCLVAARNAAGNGDVCVALVSASNVVNLGGSAGTLFNGPVNLNFQPLNNAAGITTGFLQSSSTNPAQSGVIRVADGDTGVAFRNHANTADIGGIQKDTSDVVHIGSSAGASSNGSFVANGDVTATGHLIAQTGVSNATGLQHMRFSSCTTPASANAACNANQTWPITWADSTNLNIVCAVEGIQSGGVCTN